MRHLFITVCLTLAIASCNNRPIAAFKYTELSDGLVQFADSSTNAQTYQWDFGDGTFDQEQHPTHQYPTNGKYKVTLTITSDNGESAEIISTVPVTSVKEATRIIWTKNKTYLPIEIYIDDVLVGNLREAATECSGRPYYDGFTFSASPGNHRFRAKGNNAEWDDIVLNWEAGQSICFGLK